MKVTEGRPLDASDGLPSKTCRLLMEKGYTYVALMLGRPIWKEVHATVAYLPVTLDRDRKLSRGFLKEKLDDWRVTAP